tara:strand:+ start:8399 stop:10273 length:1875 start_codon:yes stop_codon:yes gene_type:complete
MLTKIINHLLSLKRLYKNLIIVASDYFLLTFSFWLSLSIRDNLIYIPTFENNILIFLGPFIAIPIFYFSGLYQSIIRYSNIQSLLTIIKAVSIYTLLWFLLVLSVGIVSKPYDFLIINWLVTIFLTGAIRYSAQGILGNRFSQRNVLIFGAGSAGIQLEAALKYDFNYKVIAFIDKNKDLNGKLISGKRVESISSLDWLIPKKSIAEILIAIPSLSRKERYKLLQNLKRYPVIIKSIPSLSDLADGKLAISDMKKINIEDLLQREVRKPIQELINKDIQNKTVLVTGAGGSIGSEICRQIVKLHPKKLILFDISEFALYTIEKELKEIEIERDFPIFAIIGNITNQSRLEKIICNYNVNTIYHSAAYKHVPMVEKNTIAGIRCNIFGTLACINACIKNNVESFVFISTDKAVRPTNIMGATKRFAELILQSLYERENEDNKKLTTRISIVRFGNVLGSSGSVVPLFRSQIKKGGPVTVTDPRIVRYFMTIKEASQLVIQAGSLGVKGEIFVLDMGEPIQVLDLAKDMVRLSGMTIKDEHNPDGEIEIIFTGLRPGEKLFEELLIDERAFSTKHEKIMRVDDSRISWNEVKKNLSKLEEAIDSDNFEEFNDVFLSTVSGYKSSKN